MTRLSLLWSPLSRHRRLLAVALIAMAVVAVTSAAYAWLVGLFLGEIFVATEPTNGGSAHHFRGMGPSTATLWLMASLMSISILRATATYIQHRTSSSLVLHATASIRETISQHLLNAEPSAVWSLSRGELGARISTDVDRVAALLQSILSGTRGVITVLGVASFGIAMDPVLGACALLMVPGLAWTAARFAARARVHRREALREDAILTGRIAEAVTLAGLVQSYGAASTVSGHFRAGLDRVRRTFSRSAAFLYLGPPVVLVLATLLLAVALLVGAWRLNSGVITPEEHLTFLAAALFLVGPVNGLAGLTSGSAVGLGALDRLVDLLATPGREPDPPGATPLPRFRGRLTLEDVTFAYGDRLVLGPVSCEILAGESFAIVGPSGAGKTTLLRILLGLLKPTSGRVLIDGVNRSDATRESWLKQFAWVPQEPLLLADSVVANIALGDPTPDRARVLGSAEAAGVSGFVKALPEGYETILSEGASELSMGQRQRLCIARALYRDAPVLVLDEPTSSLDPAASDELSHTIDALVATRTVIVVSHRPATIRKTERVLLLTDGKVVVTGRVRELLTQSSSFREFLGATDAALA